MSRLLKRILLLILLFLTAMTVVYWDLVLYGIRQGKGQLHIIWNARPVEEFLDDPDFPDSLKHKLRLIQQVRAYAVDSLDLADTDNYKKMYDQQGEEIMWVVTACKPFALEPYEWTFPVLGAVPYKGYFNKELALRERERLLQEGYDVSIMNPGGWSTLGWFNDPILSGMLDRNDGDLASLIIHEMSHGTIFVKDSSDFNENLASFIGDRGAEKFLIDQSGEDSEPYREYINEDKDYRNFIDHMLRGSNALDSLYRSFTSTDSVNYKTAQKETMIRKIISSLDTLSLRTTRNPAARYRERLPNNAHFMSFRRYQSQQDVFVEQWQRDFNGDLRAYIRYLTERFPFL